MQEQRLLPGDYRDPGRVGKVGRGERLTEEEKRELRQMRKRQRAEHRKKKILRLDEEGVGCPHPQTTPLPDLSLLGLHEEIVIVLKLRSNICCTIRVLHKYSGIVSGNTQLAQQCELTVAIR